MTTFLMHLSEAHSQDLPNDPLGKPNVWKQLVEQPKNNGLWTTYFGKDLFDLTKEEGLQFRTWRSQLIQALDAPVVRAQIPEDDPTLNQLTNNISKNFLLIEDYFGSEFKRLGSDYTSFADKHPDGNYNKIVWVEEHEQKLKQLRVSK